MRRFFWVALVVSVFCFCVGCGEDPDDPVIEDVVDPIGPVSVSLSRETWFADPGLALVGDTVTLTLESQTEIPVNHLVQFTIAGEPYGDPVAIEFEPGSAFRYTASFDVVYTIPTGPVGYPTGPVGFSFTHEIDVVPGDPGSVIVVSPAEMAKIVTDRLRPKVDAIFDEIVRIRAFSRCMGVMPVDEFDRRSSELHRSLKQVFEEEPRVRFIIDDGETPNTLLDPGLLIVHLEENSHERDIRYSSAISIGCGPWRWRPFELLTEYLRVIYAYAYPDADVRSRILGHIRIPDYIDQVFRESADAGLTTLLRPEEIEQGLTAADVVRMQQERLENLGEEHAQWWEEWKEEQEK